MLGAIIGDLAAWTWEHHRKVFYEKLIAEDAELSCYGRTALSASSAYLTSHEYKINYKEENPYTQKASVLRLAAVVEGAWFENNSVSFRDETNYEKAESYARMFVSDFIHQLRRGAMKSAVYHSQAIFVNVSKQWNWKEGLPNNLLSYLLRAWNAFYRAYDFTSAIHNAMEWSGDKHLLGMLTGALAEAMYGCKYGFVKNKYSHEYHRQFEIAYPHRIMRDYGDVLSSIHKHQENVRVFFPKNRALTNVERHAWTEVNNHLPEKVITAELRRRILKAFDTRWGDRYGFYLDDGWIYCYRSSCLICRFQLNRLADGTYRICHLQQGDEDKSLVGFEEALYSVEYHWDKFRLGVKTAELRDLRRND